MAVVSLMMIPMLTVGSPMPTMLVGWGRRIIRIRIPGIRIVVDVGTSVVPVGIVIKIGRISRVAAGKSKTESLSSRNQHRCGGLRFRTLGNECESAYR